MNELKRKILLYDGVCGLCNGFVRFVISRDSSKRFLFAPQQSTIGRELMERYGVAHEELSTVILIDEEKNEALIKSRAVFTVLGLLDGFWPIFSVLSLLPVRLSDYCYSLVAKKRYQVFGKFDSCPMPEPGDRDQFIS